MAQEEKKESGYKNTLNLPKTDFSLRANAKENDPKMLDRWEHEDLFYKSFIHNAGKEKFILHDGPPYANGPIHLGTAYNKILKDFIGKSRRMSGMQVPITPGWDCHGLPIELNVTKEFPNLPADALLKQCRLYAEKWVEVQKEQFKGLGVLMNWQHPYLTMNFEYEATIVRAFGALVEKGYVQKQLKTVAWCPSDQTVLASAEIEYKERKDPSIYVKFPLTKTAKEKLVPELADKTVSAVIWTTTPWTLPLNRAVLLKPNTDYDVIHVGDEYVMVGQPLTEKVQSLLEQESNVVTSINSNNAERLLVQHPFVEHLEVPFLLDHHVGLDEGTALVHCAPGCGPQDYDIALKEDLEIFSPITPDGKYSVGIAPTELEGMPVADGQGWVIKKLIEKNALVHKASMKHSYPHCWRCRNGLIFRATSQWFCNLAHNDLKKRALESLETITFLPERSKNFLKATIEGRLEWCLSRQRLWGVPIPAIICLDCEYVFTDIELIETVARGIEKEGVEYWHDVSLDQLDIDPQCSKCSSKNLKKEHDILDVWFDSGVSHYAVLYKNRELDYPANIYVEGVDQHRGWFQSSLLTSLILEESPCTKSFLTHGFIVDEKGHKMSKSLGNVVAPEEMKEKLGTDGVRLWAATIDYAGDIVVSKDVLDNVTHVYRKLRNTCRFLLSNLYDFDYQKDKIELKDLLLLDQYALIDLFVLNSDIRAAYDADDFTAVVHALNDYATVQLSQLYLDVTKDRLYTFAPHCLERRSAQTAMWLILDTITKLMAPVLSFLSEEVSDHYQKNKKESIHLQPFNDLNDLEDMLSSHVISADEIVERTRRGTLIVALKSVQAMNTFNAMVQEWEFIQTLRDALLKVIEEQRKEGIIKHPLEAQLKIYVDFKDEQKLLFEAIVKRLKHSNETLSDFLKELLVVSQVTLEQKGDLPATELEGMYAVAQKADGIKCPRCWHYTPSEHEDGLCSRCALVL